MAEQLSDPTVSVNNEAIAVIPNTVMFTEGGGEQTIRAVSTGGGNVDQIYSNNVESSFSNVKFEIPPTPDNIAKAREWKFNQNKNFVQITGVTADGKIMTRSFTQAALINDYEIQLGSDTNISLEFMANRAI